MCDIEVAVICRAVSKIKRLILLLCHFSGAYQKDYQKQFSNTILTKLESLQTEFNIFADKNCRKDFSNITSIIRKQCNDFSLNKDSNEDVIVIEDICSAIAQLAELFPQVVFVYPVHLNPNVREPVNRILQGKNNVHLIEPLEVIGLPELFY